MKEKVLCLVESFEDKSLAVDIWDQENWLDNTNDKNKTIENIIPLINHPHNDIENGQKEIHYHRDNRYKAKIINNSKGFYQRVYLPLEKNQKLEYVFVEKIKDYEEYITTKRLIRNSKLKHKCIYKGKCPHRGYDLTKVKPNSDGTITCPLHGLRFDEKGKLINYESNFKI